MTALIVLSLATFRLTWLVTNDAITAPLRGLLIRLGYRLGRRDLARIRANAEKHGGIDFGMPDAWDQVVELDENPPKLAYLWTCPFCASVWIGAGVALAHRLWPVGTVQVCEALLFSAAAILVALVVERLEA